MIESISRATADISHEWLALRGDQFWPAGFHGSRHSRGVDRNQQTSFSKMFDPGRDLCLLPLFRELKESNKLPAYGIGQRIGGFLHPTALLAVANKSINKRPRFSIPNRHSNFFIQAHSHVFWALSLQYQELRSWWSKGNGPCHILERLRSTLERDSRRYLTFGGYEWNTLAAGLSEGVSERSVGDIVSMSDSRVYRWHRVHTIVNYLGDKGNDIDSVRRSLKANTWDDIISYLSQDAFHNIRLSPL